MPVYLRTFFRLLSSWVQSGRCEKRYRNIRVRGTPARTRDVKPVQNRHSEAGDGFLIHSRGIVTLLQHSSHFAPRSLTLIPLLQAR